MIELWKDIPGYEGLYQASNEGRVRSAPGKTTYTDLRGIRHWKVRILKSRGCCPAGKRASLWKDGKCKDWLQARLVALTWVPGYRDGFTVNHINGNRSDNRACNLEWISLRDNIKHGYRTGLYRKIQMPIILKDLQTGALLPFPSQAEVCRYLGKSHSFIHTRIKKGNLLLNEYEIIVA